jgi:DUF438 domain-containing protein
MGDLKYLLPILVAVILVWITYLVINFVATIIKTKKKDDTMEITKEILESILDAYSYEIVFVDRQHIVRYMNKTAKERYGGSVKINQSLFNCHSENSKVKIEEFLKRADAGEDEMFETYNTKTGEREFFVPVRDSNKHVIGYFERHEMPWDESNPKVPVTEYWKHRR